MGYQVSAEIDAKSCSKCTESKPCLYRWCSCLRFSHGTKEAITALLHIHYRSTGA